MNNPRLQAVGLVEKYFTAKEEGKKLGIKVTGLYTVFRIEHAKSGVSQTFDTIEEVLAFIRGYEAILHPKREGA